MDILQRIIIFIVIIYLVYVIYFKKSNLKKTSLIIRLGGCNVSSGSDAHNTMRAKARISVLRILFNDKLDSQIDKNILQKNKETCHIKKEDIPYFGDYLDFGCNMGVMTREIIKCLHNKLDKTFGCDVNKTLELDDINFKYLSSTHLNEIDNFSIGLITIFMVFHHLDQYFNKLLKQIVRLCKINGYLFIKEHNFNGLTKKYLDDMHLNPEWAQEHTGDIGKTKYFTYNELRTILEKNNFKHIRTYKENDKYNQYYSLYQKNK